MSCKRLIYDPIGSVIFYIYKSFNTIFSTFPGRRCQAGSSSTLASETDSMVPTLTSMEAFY